MDRGNAITFQKKLKDIVGFDASSEEGFQDVIDLSKSCKFSDCSHTKEPGCAVKKAVEYMKKRDLFREPPTNL
ncbi:hypothetical protein [Halobacillus salinus]|uniref:Ribosome small subunit-dependent GTPase A n=1 Tax=Halobacillus salinus TaxID=192814 RepID=A0A4Z0H3F0_9BACI|nr:hypothetical protein [Halobacillus salinus]TGB03715.1 hypothetical protein E4663_01550 [Halobacillus salinus]